MDSQKGIRVFATELNWLWMAGSLQGIPFSIE